MSSASSNQNLNDDHHHQQDDHLYGFYYRVHGHVQGVYFRKYTQQKANSLGLAGWIRNDKTNGTVEGQVICLERQLKNCNQMKVWLQSEGSPYSQIDHAQFETITNQKELLDIWQDLAKRNNNNNDPSQQQQQQQQPHPPVFEIRKTLKRRRK